MIIHRDGQCVAEGAAIRIVETDSFSVTIEFTALDTTVWRVSMTWGEVAVMAKATIEWLQIVTGNALGALVADLGLNVRRERGESDPAYRRRVLAVLQQAIDSARQRQTERL